MSTRTAITSRQGKPIPPPPWADASRCVDPTLLCTCCKACVLQRKAHCANVDSYINTTAPKRCWLLCWLSSATAGAFGGAGGRWELAARARRLCSGKLGGQGKGKGLDAAIRLHGSNSGHHGMLRLAPAEQIQVTPSGWLLPTLG